MNSKKGNALQLLLGCANRSKTTINELMRNKALYVVLLMMMLIAPARAAPMDDLIGSIGGLINDNKLDIIKLVVLVSIIGYAFKYLKAGDAGREAMKESLLNNVIGLVVGIFIFYNWKILVNVVLYLFRIAGI